MARKKSSFVRWHSHSEPTHSVDSLLNLTTSSPALSDDDYVVLEALLRYNFMTPSQAGRLWRWATRTSQHRFSGLYHKGLLSRGSVIDPDRPGRPHQVYALTRMGFEVLRRNGHELANEWADDWNPKHETGSQKLSVIHELGRNDVCIAILETARALGLNVVDWEGPREGTQKFLADATNHEWQRIEPDSVILLDRWQPLLIEYERSGRDTKFHKKVRAFRTYLLGKHWQNRYPREPWVVYAVPSGTGTQGLISGSYGGMVLQAGMAGARHYLFLDEEAWERGTWLATLGDGTVTRLWDAVLGSEWSKNRAYR